MKCDHEWYQGKCVHCEMTPFKAEEYRLICEENQRLRDAAKTIQNLIDEECLDKHAINPHKDSYLNENYHIEITMTVAEARLLKQALEGEGE